MEEWAAAEELTMVNADILHPLARLYTKLLLQTGRNTTITFRKGSHIRLAQGAQLAAQLMYDSRK